MSSTQPTPSSADTLSTPPLMSSPPRVPSDAADPLPARTAALAARSRAHSLARSLHIPAPSRDALHPSASYWRAEAAALRGWRRPLSASPLVVGPTAGAHESSEAGRARAELRAERRLTRSIAGTVGVAEGTIPGPEVLVDDEGYWVEERGLWEGWCEEAERRGRDVEGRERARSEGVEGRRDADAEAELPVRERVTT